MDKELHRKLAVEAFNKTWGLIDKENRTKEDNLEMIHLSHASRYHWGFAGNELNKARGEWQISRVYSLLSLGESALFHANASLRIVIENNYGDFDLVFAYEAMAFAYKVLENNCEKEINLQKGYDELKNISKKEDRDYCKSELDKI